MTRWCDRVKPLYVAPGYVLCERTTWISSPKPRARFRMPHKTRLSRLASIDGLTTLVGRFMPDEYDLTAWTIICDGGPVIA